MFVDSLLSHFLAYKIPGNMQIQVRFQKPTQEINIICSL